ncbi:MULTISPECIES: hypothetical protein [unclassified Sphingomonas]|nr:MULTISPECIES: hypothetical protein [unclassified Sphingomonas]
MMMRRVIYLQSFVAAFALMPQSAFAQMQSDGTPPRIDTRSEAGVSFSTGAYSYEEKDLSIGSGPFPASLDVSRQYTSSIGGNTSPELGSQGWTLTLDAAINNRKIDNYITQGFTYPNGKQPYVYNIVYGAKSLAFLGGTSSPTGGFIGTYRPAYWGGATLEFSGTEQDGHHTLRDSDGSRLYFGSRTQGLRVQTWTAADGTIATYTYDASNRPQIITNNRGYAVLFNYNLNGTNSLRICVVNLASDYVNASSTCPQNSRQVTYNYGAAAGAQVLTSVNKPDGNTTYYEYDTRSHLACIRKSAAGPCVINNTYNICRRDPSKPTDPPGMRWMDQVIRQETATGEVYTYSFEANPICPDPMGYRTTTSTTGPKGTKTVQLNDSGSALSITDELSAVQAATYTGGASLLGEPALVASTTVPEGNGGTYSYDTRGNLVTKKIRAKPGSGLADIASSASFPATCANPVSCNKPDYVIDANGKRTDYTYDGAHGGVLTETGPADANGIQAVKRYAYAQRYAWIKNAGGSFVQAATAVWVLTEERSCRATATTGNACAGGAADEIIVSYDYGPSTGSTGNNLLLRGKTVTAQDSDGVIRSLRTCYGYDRDGSKIWETSPRAGLAACY